MDFRVYIYAGSYHLFRCIQTHLLVKLVVTPEAFSTLVFIFNLGVPATLTFSDMFRVKVIEPPSLKYLLFLMSLIS